MYEVIYIYKFYFMICIVYSVYSYVFKEVVYAVIFIYIQVLFYDIGQIYSVYSYVH